MQNCSAKIIPGTSDGKLKEKSDLDREMDRVSNPCSPKSVVLTIKNEKSTHGEEVLRERNERPYVRHERNLYLID